MIFFYKNNMPREYPGNRFLGIPILQNGLS